jgi:hypothetical protein
MKRAPTTEYPAQNLEQNTGSIIVLTLSFLLFLVRMGVFVVTEARVMTNNTIAWKKSSLDDPPQQRATDRKQNARVL